VKHIKPARALSALVVLAGFTAATLAVNAQTYPAGPPPGGPPPPGPGMYGDRMPASDAEFVRALDNGNTTELDIAKYVVNRTKDPTIHQFAQRMIDDHSTAAVQLEATTRGTNLRPAPREIQTNGMGARMLALLQSDSGAQMDNDFMRIQVPMHRRMLGLLQWESQNGQNTGLKLLAEKLTPTVQQHLQIAQSYLAAHNLTPYSPPPPNPVPGHPNPNGIGPGPGVPNNPAAPSNGGSTSGNNNGTGGTTGNPVVAPTYAPLGSGTPAPGTGTINSPAPVPSPTAHP
jgi:predicted outer membrane protein